MRIGSRLPRSLAAVVVYAGGWGWLQVLRHVALPGPRVADALPLYEGARRDALPLLLVAGVFALTALAAAALFAPRRRGLATILSAIGTVAVTTIVCGQQLELVRQSVIGIDLPAAIRTGDPWLAGAGTLAGAPLAWVVLPRLAAGLRRRRLPRPQPAGDPVR